MSTSKDRVVFVRVTDEQAERIKASAEAVGLKVAPFVRELALNPSLESPAERRRAVAGLFDLQREVAGLVVATRGWAGSAEEAELRESARRITDRIEETIDALAAKGLGES